MTRAQARQLREQLAPTARYEKSLAITEHLLRWPPFLAAQTVMAYVSVGAEVETGVLLRRILSLGKGLALPRCKPDGIMEAHRLYTLDSLCPGRWDIPEPPGDAPAVLRKDIDLIVVPGLLFDGHGNRLGQGGGYYDRYLAGYTGVTCGLAYTAQVFAALVTRPHDVPVGALATEEGVRVFRQ